VGCDPYLTLQKQRVKGDFNTFVRGKGSGERTGDNLIKKANRLPGKYLPKPFGGVWTEKKNLSRGLWKTTHPDNSTSIAMCVFRNAKQNRRSSSTALCRRIRKTAVKKRNAEKVHGPSHRGKH